MAVVDFRQIYDSFTGDCRFITINVLYTSGTLSKSRFSPQFCPYTFRLSPIVYANVGINGKEANIYNLILHDILQPTFYFFVLVCCLVRYTNIASKTFSYLDLVSLSLTTCVLWREHIGRSKNLLTYTCDKSKTFG